MNLDEMLEKAKVDNDLDTYESLNGIRNNIDSLTAQLEDEKSKHEEELKGRDTEIEQLKNKMWDLLTNQAPVGQPQQKEDEPVKLSPHDVVSKWKKKAY